MGSGKDRDPVASPAPERDASDYAREIENENPDQGDSLTQESEELVQQELTGSADEQDEDEEETTVSDDGDGDNGVTADTDEDSSPRERKHRWLWVLLAGIVAVSAVLYFTGVIGPFGSDPGDKSATETSGAAAVGEDSGPCMSVQSVDLDQVGVLRYGDSLQYNEINPFWMDGKTANSDASAVFEGAVTELFSTVSDGCTPAGTAYWRNVLSHVIDADRFGVDNHDAATRIAVYKEEADTSVAVSTEIARQLSACSDVQFVSLTVEETPRIYVAAYAPDYNDVIFVQTPLLQIDDLSSGDKGLIVISCSFGKVEGNNGAYVNETLISPSLRAIVYLDQPTGVQVFRVVPDVVDSEEQTQEPQEQQEPQVTEEETQAPETQAPDDMDDADQTRDVAPTPTVDEPEEKPVDQTDTTDSDDETPKASEPPAVDQESTDESVGEQTDETQTPETSEVPEAVDETETGEEETETQQPEETTPTQTPEETPAMTEEEQTDDGEGTVTQPESQDECPNGCNPVSPTEEGEQQTDDDVTTDDGTGDGTSGGDGDDGSDTNGGGDCPNGDCPGDGNGNGDSGTEGGGDCPNGDCPGDGPGDDDDDGDDGTGEQPQPACPDGWIIDPFGNCKEPDPGSDGF